MIRVVEALNFRCLRYVRQPLGPFHVLVGPNASGKTTLFDALAFLSQLVEEGVDAAVGERTDNFHDLVWGRKGSRFELAIEAAIPKQFQTPMECPCYNLIRYEAALGLVEDTNDFGIVKEALLLGEERTEYQAQHGGPPAFPQTLFQSGGRSGLSSLIHILPKGQYLLAPEAPHMEQDDYWIKGRLDRKRPVFRQLNEGEFPASAWLGTLLARNIRRVELSRNALKRPSPPGKGVQLMEDGANLPWAVAALKRHDPRRFKAWLAHVRTAFSDVEAIRVVERPEDKHRYLVLRQSGGLEVPSWMLSDGTLRLLALTALAYLPDNAAIYLVDEPETSLHPLSIEPVLQSLGSVYDGQVLVATQSPSVLAASQLDKILVFSRDAAIGTRIERGDRHPALRDWKGLPNLDVLFASGVLG